MVVQASTDNDNRPFILSGKNVNREASVFLQDAGRATPLVSKTLVAKIVATGKLVPYTDETAVDGTAVPYGIYIGDDIPAADLVAGDVVDRLVVVGGDAVTFDDGQLVIENAKTLDTVIDTGTVNARTVRDELRCLGLFAESTVDVTEYEN